MKTKSVKAVVEQPKRVARGSLRRMVRAPKDGSLAKIKEDMKSHFLGQWWRKGEVVKILRSYRGRCVISKHPRKPSGMLKEGLPIINEMAGVPLSMLKVL